MRYFIAAAGNVNNSGTAIGAEWPESKLISFNFLPGDRISLNAIDTWITTIGFSRSGAAGNPITIDWYGTGANPTIDAGGSSSPVFSFSSGVHDVVIDSIIAKNSTSPLGIFYIPASCYNITITNCYVRQGIRGINAVQALGGIKILGNYFQAIADNASHSNGGGSHVQLNQCNGGGIEVASNMSYEPTPNTGIGDLLSIYKCNGLSTDYILVHDNKARGGSTHTNGYCHIVIGDVGGSYQKAYGNLSANPGMEAYQVQGGTFCLMYNNKSYSDASNPVANVGIAYGNYSGAPCNNNDIYNNNMCWKRPNGSYLGKFIDQANTTAVSTASGLAGGPTLALPPGWSSNTGANSCDTLVTDAVVPSPLWAGSPWSHVSTSLAFSPLQAKTYGAVDFDPGATSANSIAYTSSNLAVATIVSGKIHIVGAGTSTITANDGTTTISQLLTVNKAVLTVSVSNASKNYGSANPTFSASYAGFVNGETASVVTTLSSLSTTAVTGSGVGTYPITASGAAAANYSFTYVGGTLTVNAVALNIIANNQTKAYGQGNPALTLSYAGFVNNDTSAKLTVQATAATSALLGSPVGSYAIIASGASSPNYNISYVAGSLSITKANLLITANSISKVFGSLNPVLTASYSGFVNNDTAANLTAQPFLSTTATQNSAIGTYPVTASGASSPNYNITYAAGTLTVTINTLVFNALPSKTYGASDFSPGATSSTAITYSSDNTAVAIIVSGNIRIVGAGTCNITANNGSTTAVQALTVNRAPLMITADNHAIQLGAPLPVFTASYSGFVNGETNSVFVVQASFATSASGTSPIGNYPIVPSGATSANYLISYTNGILSIIPSGIIHIRGPVIVNS